MLFGKDSAAPCIMRFCRVFIYKRRTEKPDIVFRVCPATIGITIGSISSGNILVNGACLLQRDTIHGIHAASVGVAGALPFNSRFIVSNHRANQLYFTSTVRSEEHTSELQSLG